MDQTRSWINHLATHYEMKYLLRSFFFVLSLLLTSCKEDAAVEELAEPNPSIDGIYSYSLQFDAPYPHYDGENTTRATEAKGWEDGDIVYMYLDTPNNAYAQATYSSQTETWTIECDKQLIDATESNCVVWHGRYPEEELEYEYLSEAFLCQKGSYNIENESVIVSASLKPYGRRLRFANPDNQEIQGSFSLNGFTTSFRPLVSISPNDKNMPFLKDKYSSTLNFIFNNSKSTNYIVYEIGEDTRMVELQYGWNNWHNYNTFRRYFDDHSLFFGESGVFSIPTRENLRGWTLTSYE